MYLKVIMLICYHLKETVFKIYHPVVKPDLPLSKYAKAAGLLHDKIVNIFNHYVVTMLIF